MLTISLRNKEIFLAVAVLTIDISAVTHQLGEEIETLTEFRVQLNY